jgi:5-methylcytosine-specific restriction endonuclease McrA
MLIDQYIQVDRHLETYWRGLILFGRNSASYKFAFAKSLISLRPNAGDLLRLEDIAPVYAQSLIEHLKGSPKQGTSKTSKFIDALRRYGVDEPDQSKLIEATVKDGFNNVVKAFQVLGSDVIDTPFYVDEVKSHGGIRITENFSRLLERPQVINLAAETESRWRLVERAWELGLSPHLLSVGYDRDDQILFTIDEKSNRRKSVTGARGALNGYQKGRCFYCKAHINVEDGNETHVDHFHPHKLRGQVGEQINGVWNLVLACSACNGPSGKWDRRPAKWLLERLQRRNDYLIESHHPLRETLLQQTGLSAVARRSYLNDFYDSYAIQLGTPWDPPADRSPVF